MSCCEACLCDLCKDHVQKPSIAIAEWHVGQGGGGCKFCICLAFSFLSLWQSMDKFMSHAPF